MAGFSNITASEAIMFADNASFDGTERGGRMTADGELWIGSTASPHVRKATLTNGNNITFTNGTGSITANVTGTSNHSVQVGNATGSLTSIATGTTGQVLQSAGASADPAWVTPPGYTLSMSSQSSASCNASTTYYFSDVTAGTLITGTTATIYLIAPFSGTLKAVFGSFRKVGNAVTGNSTVNVVVNGAATVVSNTVTFASAAGGFNPFSNSAMSVAITAGDKIEFNLATGAISAPVLIWYNVTALIQ